MDDNLWGNLEPVTGATSKRPGLSADAPTKQPMRAGIKPAQQKAPTADQKKYRRQRAVNKRSSMTPTKESSMSEQTPTPEDTEAGLLARLASATTLTEQAAIASLLDSHRAQRREAISAEAGLDWGAMDTPVQHEGFSQAAQTYLSTVASLMDDTTLPSDNTVVEHISAHRTTADSDWLMDEFGGEVDEQAMATAMRAQAVGWYENGVWGPVKDSREEFSVQAHNAARNAGSLFGLRATAAASVFIDAVDHLYRKDKGASIKTAGGVCSNCNGTGAVFPYGAPCRQCAGTGKVAAWGDNDMPKGEGGVPTYVTDGKDSLPVGVDPAKVDTFDEDTLPGADGNSSDPKSQTTTADAPSLSEGSQPEGDHSESPENPLTGDTSVDKSTFNVGDTSDKMNTQGQRTAGEYGGGSPKHGDKSTCHADNLPIEFFDGQWMHYANGPSHNDVYPATPRERAEKAKEGAFFHHDTSSGDGPMGAQSEWDSLAKQVRQQREQDEEEKQRAMTQTNPSTAGLNMFEALMVEAVAPTAHTADAQSSEWGLGLGIDEGDSPEGDHAEAPTQNNGEGAADKSHPTDSDRPGGGVEWGNTGGAATSQQGAYTSSLSPNAQVFLQTLQTMSSLDDVVAGISGHQIVGFLKADPTVPANLREALKAGGNPFVRSGATYESELWAPMNGNCTVYPEGATDEDGADEPSCEQHRTINGRVVHQMSNGLYRVTEGGNYIDGVEDRDEALNLAREGSRKTAARDCVWTRVSEPGEDDGLTWWECSTHGKTEMGGETEPPSFPCEGWLDENAAENPYKGGSKTGALARPKEGTEKTRRDSNSTDYKTAKCDNCGTAIYHRGQGWHHQTGGARCLDSNMKSGARDTGTCSSCGRAISYDSQDRKWTHDDGEDYGHSVRRSALRTTADSDLFFGPGSDKNPDDYEAVEGTCKNCGKPIMKSADGRWYHKGSHANACEGSDKGAEPKSASLHEAAGRGPAYNPSSTRDLPLHGTVTGTEYYYNEGYDHAVAGQDRKGYGSRDKTILYSHGYEHGLKDKGKTSSLPVIKPIFSRMASVLKQGAVTPGTWNGHRAEIVDTPGGLAVIVRLPEGAPDLGYAPGSEFLENTNDPSIVRDSDLTINQPGFESRHP